MSLERLDPRTRLFLLIGLSSSALISQRPAELLAILFLSALILLTGGVKLSAVLTKLRGLLGLIVTLFCVQCLFTRGGEPIITIAGLILVTDYGFKTALLISLRLLIFALSALIVLCGQIRDYIPALSQCGIPYEIVFMLLAALRFLPMLREEARDVLCAAQMRGLRIKKSGLRNKAGAYISIILPVLAGAIRRTERLSVAMEARAFRALPHRTSMRRLSLRANDWIYAAVFCVALAAIFFGGGAYFVSQ